MRELIIRLINSKGSVSWGEDLKMLKMSFLEIFKALGFINLILWLSH